MNKRKNACWDELGVYLDRIVVRTNWSNMRVGDVERMVRKSLLNAAHLFVCRKFWRYGWYDAIRNRNTLCANNSNWNDVKEADEYVHKKMNELA